jgi:SAM-dependent methyltransferase
MVARLLRDRLVTLWPSLTGQSVLGLGYAAPYLRLWREGAERCIALMPSQVGPARWPAGSPNLSCTAEEDALPFPDLCFDRIVLVHGLEAAEHARRLLREVWRVLKDDGRLLVVAPNRRGMWAYLESTPFGHGQPYSAGQIGRLLAGSMFRVERRDAALFMPPIQLRPMLRAARLWESGARRVLPQYVAGLTITEAVKDMYAAVPVTAALQRRIVLAEAA